MTTKQAFIEFASDHLPHLINALQAADLFVGINSQTGLGLHITPQDAPDYDKLVLSAPQLVDLLQRFEIDITLVIHLPIITHPRSGVTNG